MFIGISGTQFPLTGAILTMSWCNFIRAPNTAYTNPTVNVVGGTIVATANAQNQAGTGSGWGRYFFAFQELRVSIIGPAAEEPAAHQAKRLGLVGTGKIKGTLTPSGTLS